MKYDLITILGPTASGKTSLATRLAFELNGEIISADSRQVYRLMDIGTGKDLSDYVVDGVHIPYHLIDIVEPGYKYNLFEYQRDFLLAYNAIRQNGRQAILCGGTGLYIESILKGYKLVPVPENPILRAELEMYELPQLTEKLKTYKQLHNTTDVDTIIIARGGGSTEDLWPFNDEKLAYEIYNSYIPIISGVGHETDFTICDFVSDLRAPTPSAAAELAVPDIREQKYYIASLKDAIENYFKSYIDGVSYDLDKLVNSKILQKPENITENCELYIDSLYERLCKSFKIYLTEKLNYFAILCSKLDSLSPLKVLSRGYAIIKKDDTVILDADNLATGDIITFQLKGGTAKAEIIEVQRDELNI